MNVLFIYLSIYLFVCLFIYFIYLFINKQLHYLQKDSTLLALLTTQYYIFNTERAKSKKDYLQTFSSKELSKGKTKIIQKNSVVEHKTLKYEI